MVYLLENVIYELEGSPTHTEKNRLEVKYYVYAVAHGCYRFLFIRFSSIEVSTKDQYTHETSAGERAMNQLFFQRKLLPGSASNTSHKLFHHFHFNELLI
jgi:hypothetical protein